MMGFHFFFSFLLKALGGVEQKSELQSAAQLQYDATCLDIWLEEKKSQKNVE